VPGVSIGVSNAPPTCPWRVRNHGAAARGLVHKRRTQLQHPHRPETGRILIWPCMAADALLAPPFEWPEKLPLSESRGMALNHPQRQRPAQPATCLRTRYRNALVITLAGASGRGAQKPCAENRSKSTLGHPLAKCSCFIVAGPSTIPIPRRQGIGTPTRPWCSDDGRRQLLTQSPAVERPWPPDHP